MSNHSVAQLDARHGAGTRIHLDAAPEIERELRGAPGRRREKDQRAARPGTSETFIGEPRDTRPGLEECPEPAAAGADPDAEQGVRASPFLGDLDRADAGVS